MRSGYVRTTGLPISYREARVCDPPASEGCIVRGRVRGAMLIRTARALSLLLLIALLVGCGQVHTLEWPGIVARTRTLFGETPSYSKVAWHGHPGLPCNEIVCAALPAFSAGLPDGRVIRPSEFTVARLESHGAKESRRRSSGPPLPGHQSGRTLKIESSAGVLIAAFDAQERLTSVQLIASSSGQGTVAVGDRNGKREVPLPASREALVEVFGEPERERERAPHPIQFGRSGGATPRGRPVT
jgi:hypothetical protein